MRPDFYTREMLNSMARDIAREHSKANGGGRAVGVRWEIAPTIGGMSLYVAYTANRPDGNCGVYCTNYAL